MGYDLLIAREEMLKTSVVEIVHIIFRIGLSIIALSLGWGLVGVYLASMVSGLGSDIGVCRVELAIGGTSTISI